MLSISCGFTAGSHTYKETAARSTLALDVLVLGQLKIETIKYYPKEEVCRF
jgi:hypothetical protein